MQSASLNSYVLETLQKAQPLIANSNKPEVDIMNQNYSEFESSLFYFFARVGKNKFVSDLSYYTVHTEISRSTENAKSRNTKWVLLNTLLYSLIPKINPKADEYKIFLNDLAEMAKDKEFLDPDSVIAGISASLFNKLLPFFQEQLVRDFLLCADVNVQIVLLNSIQLNECNIALATFLEGMLDTIKDICNGQNGKTYGIALTKFLTSYNYGKESAADEKAISSFYKKIIPEAAGKLRESAAIRRIVSYACALCSKNIESKLVSKQEKIIDYIDSDLYLPTYYVVEKALSHSIKLDVPKIIETFNDKKSPSVELFSKINEHIKSNYPEVDFYAIKITCTKFLVCNHHVPSDEKLKIIKNLLDNGQFEDASTALTYGKDASLYDSYVARYTCCLIDNGISSDTILRYCSNQNVIAIINCLISDSFNFYHQNSFYSMVKLLCDLIECLLLDKDKEILSSSILEISFDKMDVLAYILLLDMNKPISLIGKTLLGYEIKLFVIVHPNWEEINLSSVPLGIFMKQKFNDSIKQKPIDDVFQMVEEEKEAIQLSDLFDFSNLSNDQTRIWFTCKICVMQIKENPNTKDCIKECLQKVDREIFSPPIIALKAITDIDFNSSANIDNFNYTVIVGLSNVSKELRGDILNNMKTANYSKLDQITLLSFIVQNMINSNEINQEYFNTAMDILNIEFQTFKRGFKRTKEVSKYSLNYAYVLMIILQKLQTNINYKLTMNILEFLNKDGIKIITNNVNYTTGLKYKPEIVLFTKLILRILEAEISVVETQTIINSFKSISLLSDIQIGSVSFNEISKFIESIKKEHPNLIETIINSIDTKTSEQNVVIYSVLALTYSDMLTDKTDSSSVIFSSFVSNAIGLIGIPKIKKLLKKVKFDGITFRFASGRKLIKCIKHMTNDMIKNIVKAGVEMVVSTKSLNVQRKSFDILVSISKYISVDSQSDFDEMFDQIFSDNCESSIRRYIIKNIFGVINQSKIAMLFSISKTIKENIFDEVTWNMYSQIEPLLTLIFIYDYFASGKYQSFLSYVLIDLQARNVIPEIVFVLIYTEFLHNENPQIVEMAKNKIKAFLVERNVSDIDKMINDKNNFIDFDKLHEIIKSNYSEEDILQGYSYIMTFNVSQEYICENSKGQIGEDTFNSMKLSLIYSIATKGEVVIQNFFSVAKKLNYINFVKEAAKILIRSDSKFVCKHCLEALAENDLSKELIKCLAQCIPRGLISITEARKLIGNTEYNNNALSFWLKEEGEISKEDLRNAFYYGGEDVIEVLVNKAEMFSKEQLRFVAPLVFLPEKINFVRVLPFINKIPKEILEECISSEFSLLKECVSISSVETLSKILSISQ